MELLRYILDNVLGPVFDHDLAMVRSGAEVGDDEEEEAEASLSCELNGRSAARKSGKLTSGNASAKIKQTASSNLENAGARNAGDAILDPSGPKLMDGLRNWIFVYQLIGIINLPRTPLYLALIYRVCVLTLANYIMNTHFIFKFLFTPLLMDLNYANPVFILINFLTFSASMINTGAIFYTGTFNLCPLFKILNTPRLCYVNRRTQNAAGSNTLKYMLVFYVYQTLCYRMLAHNNFEHFIHQFDPLDFLLEYFTIIVFSYNIVGLTHLDFYIRSCFGAWLLALETNLGCRRARFRYLDRRRRRHGSASSIPATVQGHSRRISTMSQFRKSYLFISLDDIQKSLNAMDDHLEVTRSIQTLSIVLVSLLAFLGCGVFFLIAYNVFAKSNDYYHGILLVLISLNYAFLVMLTYLGDSFLFYALAKLVQTVEDEYFLQKTEPKELSGDDDDEFRSMSTRTTSAHFGTTMELGNSNSITSAPTTVATIEDDITAIDAVSSSKQLLLIKRSDVLFGRELLVQLENHLATPWSKLTFKSHLNIMGTFATLIAAQIIFDTH